ncbi:DNA topoisomerase I [Candidatus Micrarchaeota archaeon CG1_02_55_22]|nr:MAG: DNA topoisomerase I [Candidatus Micrarchaeota archaeon CG1_02_55_22]
MHSLVIAEKPSSCQKIAFALADGSVKREVKRGIAFFSFSRGGKNVCVAPAVGHLYGLAEKKKSWAYPVFDVEWQPSSEMSKTSAYTKAYLQNIKDLAKGAQTIYLATDYDVEGEVIGANVLEFACKAKNGRRMKFSTLTKPELVAAFDNALASLDKGMVAAGRTRHMLDYFWGISVSRALMSAMRRAGRFQVMSVGRVQGPTLAVLAKREKEISTFISKPYWEVYADIKAVVFGHCHGRFDDGALAEDAVNKSGKSGVVTGVRRSKYNQMPPFPFDLTTLQTEAYSAFGFTPTQTLQLAQNLYENAFISYPRTSSQQLSEKLGLPEILGKISENPSYKTLAKKLIDAKRFTPHNGKNTDPAHPAIYPTGVMPVGLTAQQAKLYDLIARRFLACFAAPSLRERMRVDVKLGSEDYSVTGSRTLEQQWLEYYGKFVKLDEVTIPEFVEGEKVDAKKVWSEEKTTQPPKRFTEASIVRKLETEKLGTKATRASIVQTLFDRGYLIGKSITVTPLGMSVYDSLAKDVPDIVSEELTRHFEEDMEKITEGTKADSEVIDEGKAKLVELLDNFKSKEQEVGRGLLSAFNITQHERNVVGACKCGGKLVMRTSKYGQFVGCSNYPDCRNTYPLPHEAKVDSTGKTCVKCGTPIVLVKRKGKRPWRMCLSTTCETKAAWASKDVKVAAPKPVKK